MISFVHLGGQPHKIFKHTQTIRRLLPTDCLSMFDHFAGLALKGLNTSNVMKMQEKILLSQILFMQKPLQNLAKNLRWRFFQLTVNS